MRGLLLKMFPIDLLPPGVYLGINFSNQKCSKQSSNQSSSRLDLDVIADLHFTPGNIS